MILGADGRPDLDLRDPVCDDFFQSWQDTAESNANIYEQVGKGGGQGCWQGEVHGLSCLGWDREEPPHSHPHKGMRVWGHHEIQWLRVSVEGYGGHGGV